MTTQPVTPIVMTFAGLDPTGGAGLQADIEAIASMGCHATPIATCLTAQDTNNVISLEPVDSALLITQARAVLEDMPVKVIKLSLMASVEIVEAIHSILKDYPQIPVVFDPIISAGGGKKLTSDNTLDAISELILPYTTLITPNSEEAMLLAKTADTLDASAMSLLSQGCEYVLITGAHRKTPNVINTLYGSHRKLEEYTWDRLPGTYHGSGCTLSAATAALLAQGQEPIGAIHDAQRYAWQTLLHGQRLGMGQSIPGRFFWIHSVAHKPE